ncbi:MAG TPA: MarR family transcriptional regulator [Jiangellaceae bacterium]
MASASDTPDRVTPEELEVWRTFIRVHAQVLRRLEADLVERHGLPLAWYDVLVRLLEADERRLRMTELADRVMLSPSGLTRLVDRMVDEGLVRREQAERDGRGFYAVLTDVGYERLREATGTHLRGVREYVISRFEPDELAQMSELLRRIDA